MACPSSKSVFYISQIANKLLELAVPKMELHFIIMFHPKFGGMKITNILIVPPA